MMVLMASSVIVVLLVILAGRFALRGKGLVVAKLAAFLLIVIVLWTLIAMKSASTATQIAGSGANGVSGAITGLVHFLNDLFG